MKSEKFANFMDWAVMGIITIILILGAFMQFGLIILGK
jgi:hypothetical protein